jgi:hypothetical protein
MITKKIFLRCLNTDSVENTITDGITNENHVVKKYIIRDFYFIGQSVGSLITDGFTNGIIAPSKKHYHH